MKIICNKDEFSMLVRNCLIGSRDDQCCGCVFAPVCAHDGDPCDGDTMCRIEDICELDIGE